MTSYQINANMGIPKEENLLFRVQKQEYHSSQQKSNSRDKKTIDAVMGQ
jgi:hypothetical protein